MVKAFSRSTASQHAVRWDEPLYTVERAQADETHRRIGEQVATLIEDGATLQLGIGAIPDATLQALSDRRDLGVHSEMFSDGVLDLVERGVITGARKAVDRGKIVASFVIGSRRLLDFIDDNPMVELRSADYTNNTSLIRQFEHMVAVNSAIQVDLTGQVCAESLARTSTAAWAARWTSCVAQRSPPGAAPSSHYLPRLRPVVIMRQTPRSAKSLTRWLRQWMGGSRASPRSWRPARV